MRIRALLLGCLLTPSAAIAQLHEQCRAIITDGLREYSIKQSSRAYLNTVFDRFCDASGTVRTSGWSAGLDLVVKSIPVGLTGEWTSTEQAVRNFCRNYASETRENTSSIEYQERIVERAYSSFDQCIAMANNGVVVRHDVRSAQMMDFFLAPGFARPVTIVGMDISPNVTCTTQRPGSEVGSQPPTRPWPVDTLGKGSRYLVSSSQTLNIACTRRATIGPDSTRIFEEAHVTLLTDLAPSGNYNAFMPREERLPENRASAVARELETLRASNTALTRDLAALRDITGQRFGRIVAATSMFYIGEFDQTGYAAFPHSPCGTDAAATAKRQCDSILPGSRAKVHAIRSKGGNQCGYTLFSVTCLLAT